VDILEVAVSLKSTRVGGGREEVEVDGVKKVRVDVTEVGEIAVDLKRWANAKKAGEASAFFENDSLHFP
jgi:hypothetical protein